MHYDSSQKLPAGAKAPYHHSDPETIHRPASYEVTGLELHVASEGWVNAFEKEIWGHGGDKWGGGLY